LSQIADELHVSTSSLIRAFRDRGLSPMRFANSVRLEHASRMLQGPSRITVQEVAAHCGFTSLAHFSRSFKKSMAWRRAIMRHLIATNKLLNRDSSPSFIKTK
jgi:AraC-like DNA-binding protein